MITNFRNKSLSQRQELLENRHTYIELVNRHDSNFDLKKKLSHSIGPSITTQSDHLRMILSDLSQQGRLARQIQIMRRQNPYDLTYIFITAGFNYNLTMAIVLLLTIIRYLIIGYLVYLYIFYDPFDWKYVFVILLARFVFLILVLKVSLKDPETPTEILLRTHWSSKTNSLFIMFELIDGKKLLISILRGFCPPQLSFLYLKGEEKLKLYQAINYIYFSIEAVVFYPVLIAQLIIIGGPEGQMGPQGIVLFALAVFAQTLTLTLTGFLYFLSCYPEKQFKNK